MPTPKRLTVELQALFKLAHIKGTSSIRIHQLAIRVDEYDRPLAIVLKIENEEILSGEEFLIYRYVTGTIGRREELN